MDPGSLVESGEQTAIGLTNTARPPPERAPSRGHYDRALPREHRQSEQRTRLLHATAAAFCEGGTLPSISQVVARAGVGRSTFYEFFDGTEHALRGAREAGIEQLKNALEQDSNAVETPLESLRRLMHAWCSVLERHSILLRAALFEETTRAPPVLLLLETRLRDYQKHAVQSGSSGQPASDDALRLVAGGLVALARAFVNVPGRTCDRKVHVEFVQRGLRA